jgi:hypothetical protein
LIFLYSVVHLDLPDLPPSCPSRGFGALHILHVGRIRVNAVAVGKV